jgi:iron-sulfur cluster repair protein YtfE (RIC family)
MADPDTNDRMKHPPLKRHLSLQPLSRDHYGGLVQSQQLLRAAEQEPEERKQAITGFLNAWQEEISLHFRDEERLLEPLMSEPDIRRLRDDHAELRVMAAEAPAIMLEDEPDPQWLTRLGQTLHDHIRWEERALFPAIEQTATQSQLQALLAETDLIEASRPRSAGK